jgi:uncharacterized OB-fold protein
MTAMHAATATNAVPRDNGRKVVPEPRKCLNCPTVFAPKRDHGRFCEPACAKAWNNRNLGRGGPLAPLVLAWTATRHAKPGTPEAEVCAFARRELTSIASLFLEDDAKNDREGAAVAWVQAMMDSGTLYIDRARN